MRHEVRSGTDASRTLEWLPPCRHPRGLAPANARPGSPELLSPTFHSPQPLVGTTSHCSASDPISRSIRLRPCFPGRRATSAVATVDAPAHSSTASNSSNSRSRLASKATRHLSLPSPQDTNSRHRFNRSILGTRAVVSNLNLLGSPASNNSSSSMASSNMVVAYSPSKLDSSSRNRWATSSRSRQAISNHSHRSLNRRVWGARDSKANRAPCSLRQRNHSVLSKLE